MTASGTSSAPDHLTTAIPLSLQQEFFCTLDKGDVTGAFGARHVVGSAWRLHGPLDVETLRHALGDVVERHEMLRTSISRDAGDRHQRVHPATPVRLHVRDLSGTARADRDTRAEEFFNEIESSRYPVRELPHLRAAVGRFDDEDAVLVLVVHHVAADGWSMRVVIRDLALRYAARRGHRVPEPPPVRQYQEYVAWQREVTAGDALEPARAFWREKLRGAQMVTLPADRMPSGDAPAVYANHRSLIGEDVTAAALKLARALRSSPFMVFVSAYNLLLRRLTGIEDMVVGTFSSGRAEESFHGTVGPFLNFLPLRTDLAGCRTFREVVERTRATCLQAYVHDIPFPLIEEEAPGLMEPAAAPGRELIAFEVLQFPPGLEGAPVGDLRYTELRRRVLSETEACDIPDGALWALDVLPSGGTAGSLKFNAGLFDAGTMGELVDQYARVLRSAVTDPDAPVTRI